MVYSLYKLYFLSINNILSMLHISLYCSRIWFCSLQWYEQCISFSIPSLQSLDILWFFDILIFELWVLRVEIDLFFYCSFYKHKIQLNFKIWQTHINNCFVPRNTEKPIIREVWNKHKSNWFNWRKLIDWWIL